MRVPFRNPSRRRRRVAGATALSLAAGTLVVLAVTYDGAPIHDVDLNDGGVWVTNGDEKLMARLNSQVKELELGVATTATSDQVFQEANDVAVFDDGGGDNAGARSVQVVDTLRGVPKATAIPPSWEASAGRGLVAFLDDETGNAWLRRSDRLEGLEGSTPPDLELSPRGSVVVTTGGRALFLDRRAGEVQEWAVDVSGTPTKGRSWDFGARFRDNPVLAAVGDTPVVLQGEQLLLPGEDPVELDGEPMLQHPGPAAEDVYAATADGLWRVPAGGGDPERVEGPKVDGLPARPAVVGECVHAAWADPGTENFLRVCGEESFEGELQAVGTDAELVFRSNRKVVVLNDVANGNAWLVQPRGITLVDDWDSVDPKARDPRKAEVAREEKSNRRNKPPEAKPDDYGARPDSTVVLPVTLNDVDADGDIVTITGPPDPVDGVQFSVVGDGTQVQAQVPKGARGEIEFEYEITDGRAGNASSDAKVSLTVMEGSVDTAPKRIEDQKNQLTVANGRRASVNVLPAWIDPQGDPLVLVGASSPDGKVEFRPDGTVEFTDDGSGRGPAKIDFEVRGGEASTKSSVAVRVEDENDVRPTTVADHFTGTSGSTILLEPLRNDVDPLGRQLTMSRIDVSPDTPGGTLDRDLEGGTARFTARTPGTYYLDYDAKGDNNRASERTLIRVDVMAAAGVNRRPVATRDLAVVRPDTSALVDVLANDSDPDRDVLVVQGVQVPEEFAGRLKASLINKRYARVELLGPLGKEEPELTYQLSDGRSEPVDGRLAVVAGKVDDNRTPVAVPDKVTGRAGTIINVPVLDNDVDPDNDRLTVNQDDLFDVSKDKPVISEGKVPVVATGSTIRVLLPDDGTSQLEIGYGVRDPDRARDDEHLVIDIRENTRKDNLRPAPLPIEERTVSGQRIRVPVDVFGADPDGDPVVFTGVETPPRLGRIVSSGTSWFDYEPFEGDGEEFTGTDTFKIVVSDSYGAPGIAEVRIGVAPRSTENQAPAALNDEVLVKPGRTLRYPVTDNDSDPDGDSLSFVPDSLAPAPGVQARTVGDTIQVEVPEQDGETETSHVAQYTVTDGLGSSSSALLSVRARPDAPDHAPLAQDDVMTADMLAGKSAGDTVDVDVLGNDGDLDGSVDDLTISAVDDRVSEVVDRKLRITLGKQSQVVPYRVTDRTDHYSYGFVYVTGVDSMPPTLNLANVPVEVVAGEPEEIDLDDVVVVRPGREPRFGKTDQIPVSNGDVVVPDEDTFRFEAPASGFGPASVTLEVLDGTGLNDPSALSSQVTVPINVLPAGDVPPRVRSTSVVVHAGGDPETIQLDRLATDANREDVLTFETGEAPEGVEASIEDDVLQVSAQESAPSGEQSLEVEVRDGTGDPAIAEVRVRVIGADSASVPGGAEPGAAPMTLRPLAFEDGRLGKEVEFKIASAVLTDPLPGKSKRILSARLVGGKGDVDGSGETLSITPRATGQVVAEYTLDDGSGVPARAVTGVATVTAFGPPDRPGRPEATAAGGDRMLVSWSAPADNGRPITHYLLRGGGKETRCRATQCEVTGLDPGHDYSFRVRAVNEVDASEPSAPSRPVDLDVVPGPMNAPVVTSGFHERDGKLRLRWGTPLSNEGTAPTRFELQIGPRAGAGSVDKVQPASSRGMTWGALNNGTSYTFRIRAVNAEGAGPWSPSSKPTHPFGAPGAMSSPGLQPTSNGNTDGQGWLDVSWSALGEPGNGYDPVIRYQVRVLKGSRVLTRVPVAGNVTERSFDVSNGATYTAQVRAVNRAGVGPWSAQSPRRVVYDKATAPESIRRIDNCFEMRCVKHETNYVVHGGFKTPSRNGGFPVTKYRYTTSDGYTATFAATRTGLGVDIAKAFRFNQAGIENTTRWARVKLTPITEVPGVGDVEGVTSDFGGSFQPWAKPKRPTVRERIYQVRRAVLVWDCVASNNGRNVAAWERNMNLFKPSSVTMSRGADGKGCNTIRFVWENVPPGDYRCAQVRVRYYAEGTKSYWSEKRCSRSKR